MCSFSLGLGAKIFRIKSAKKHIFAGVGNAPAPSTNFAYEYTWHICVQELEFVVADDIA